MVDNQEFQSTYNQYSSLLYRFILYKVKDKQLAQDILQEVFIKFLNYQNQIKSQQKIKSWLYKVASNTIIDHYRKNDKQEILTHTIKETKVYEEEFFQNEFIKCIDYFINELPKTYKKTITFYEKKELSAKEISKQLQIPLSTIKSQIQRGRKKIKEAFFQCCEFSYDNQGSIIELHPKCCTSPKCLKN